MKYSSAYTDEMPKKNDDEQEDNTVINEKEEGGNLVNSYHKAKEFVLKLDNTELNNLKEMAKLMSKLLPHIHKSDEEFSKLVKEHGGSFFGKIGNAFKKAGNWVGKTVKNTVNDTVHTITHPSPKNLLKLAAKGALAVGVSGNPLLTGAIGMGIDKSLDKAFGGAFLPSTDMVKEGVKTISKIALKKGLEHLHGSLTDIGKTNSHHHLVEMLEKDQKIMAENNERLSHFLHALELTNKLNKNLS